jgi:hypothetical protein
MRSSPALLRVTVHSTFAALWLTGAAVFVLKHFMPVTTEFGPAPHPWHPRLLVMHGIVAVLATFLFGWVSGDHVAATWGRGVDRASGVWLLILISALIVTGFAAFFLVADSIRSVNGTAHEFLGLALMLPWIAHRMWGRGGRRSRA